MTRNPLHVRSPDLQLDENAQTARFVRGWRESRVSPAQRLAAATVLFLASILECFTAFFNLVTGEFRRTQQPKPVITAAPVAQPAPRPVNPPVSEWRTVFHPLAAGKQPGEPIQSEWVTRGDRERAQIEAAFAPPYRLPPR